MRIDDARTRAAQRAFGNRVSEKNASNQSGGSLEEKTLEEGEKKHHTPKFVQHCVTAITEKPESLERVEKDAPKGADGSPFAICWAAYKKKRRALAAKHAKGKHHTVKEYEGALKKLREAIEELRTNRPPRSAIIFEALTTTDPKGVDRRLVTFRPPEE